MPNLLHHSIKHLMSGIIDYAGFFPPANLDLQTSIKNYSNYIRSNDGWMISKFILPAVKLGDLTQDLLNQFSKEYPLDLSLITSDFLKDKAELITLMDNQSDRLFCTGIESRINDINSFESIYEKNRTSCSNFSQSIQSFYEIERTSKWERDISKIVLNLAELNKNYGLKDGFKLRCGGVEKEHFPSPEECASAINICRNHGVPMKFTAGLHHPIRHLSDSVNTKMYGFFNIFIGGMLSHKYQLDNVRLNEILIDEDPNHFQFFDDSMKWNDLELTNAEIQNYKSNAFISYGSCSFDEPREDLKVLGLL